MTAEEFDFSTVTVQPSEPEKEELKCTVCSTPLTYSGKGRKPTKCAEHKKRPSVSAPRRVNGRSSKNAYADYRPGIMGLMQLPAGVLAFAGMNKPVFAADAAAISIYSPGIAESLNELAKERPEVAAVLDRVLSVGPYGLVIAAVAPMVLQLLANHGVLPEGLLGTVSRDALLTHMADQTREHEDAMKAAMAA